MFHLIKFPGAAVLLLGRAALATRWKTTGTTVLPVLELLLLQLPLLATSPGFHIHGVTRKRSLFHKDAWLKKQHVG